MCCTLSVSSTKSPQQIIGSIVKDYLSSLLHKKYVCAYVYPKLVCLILYCVEALLCFTLIRPHQIYHVTVMPCFDKKLEASRSDFYNDVYKTRDVDCVITSGEA